MSPLHLSLRFLQTQPDARLLALAGAGHERAFEALFRRYRRPLLAYCRRLASSSVSAEDALQQAFLQAWIAVRAGVDVRDARAWLYRIAHNVVVSSVRRPSAVDIGLRDRQAAIGADAEAEQRMAARDALAGLASLPDTQRAAMISAAMDGLSHAEIARELGVSSGAVRGLIYRARSTLRAAGAIFIPGPLVHWAARQTTAPSGFSEALAGGGSAGVGGLLLKTGLITATAGVLATAVGVVNHYEHWPRPKSHPVVQAVGNGGGRGRSGIAGGARAPVRIVAAAELTTLPIRPSQAPRVQPGRGAALAAAGSPERAPTPPRFRRAGDGSWDSHPTEAQTHRRSDGPDGANQDHASTGDGRSDSPPGGSDGGGRPSGGDGDGEGRGSPAIAAANGPVPDSLEGSGSHDGGTKPPGWPSGE